MQGWFFTKYCLSSLRSKEPYCQNWHTWKGSITCLFTLFSDQFNLVRATSFWDYNLSIPFTMSNTNSLERTIWSLMNGDRDHIGSWKTNSANLFNPPLIFKMLSGFCSSVLHRRPKLLKTMLLHYLSGFKHRRSPFVSAEIWMKKSMSCATHFLMHYEKT